MSLKIPQTFGNLKEGRLSVPSAGRTIFSSVRPWIQPMSIAFGMLTKDALDNNLEANLWRRYCDTFSPIMSADSLDDLSSETKLRLCTSAILCEWMLYRAANPNAKSVSFEEAEEWFIGNDKSRIPGLVIGDKSIKQQSIGELEDLSFGDNFLDLFPYILEWFDSVTISGDIPGRELLRKRKRELGIVYTPSDVVDFIVGHAIQFHITEEAGAHTLDNFGVLDPGCGTGAFLRSALDMIKALCDENKKATDVVKYLYGMDVSPQAIQSCAFALVAHCIGEIMEDNLSPWRIWQATRGNLAVVDSTLVFCDHEETEIRTSITERRSNIRAMLLALPHSNTPTALPLNCHDIDQDKGYNSKSPANAAKRGTFWLRDIFPEYSTGFPVVIGNPPYSRLPWDSYSGVRAAHFKTAPNSIKNRDSNYYTLFVEMMWQLTKPGLASAGMVVPLSISYSSLPSIKRLRTSIQDTPGTWQFAFFDRTPDSLFGDDVKTRNAVILWKHSLNDDHPQILTGPLMRWSSRDRKELFKQIYFVPLNAIAIRDIIPKIGGTSEVAMYECISRAKGKLSTLFIQNNERNIQDSKPIFYSSVAYNWIPVFRVLPGKVNERPSIQALYCRDEQDAWFVFACLISRLTYWLWRVEGDGFHVTKDFIYRLPFHPSALNKRNLKRLIILAQRMWNRMLQNPVVSVNKGKQTTSYYPFSCDEELESIDSVLLGSLGLSESYISFFIRFVTNNIIAGRYNEIRTNPALRRLSDKEGLSCKN